MCFFVCNSLDCETLFKLSNHFLQDFCTVQYNTVHYSTLHYITVQYSTVQYSTVQYSTVQYSKKRRSVFLNSSIHSLLTNQLVHFISKLNLSLFSFYFVHFKIDSSAKSFVSKTVRSVNWFVQ